MKPIFNRAVILIFFLLCVQGMTSSVGTWGMEKFDDDDEFVVVKAGLILPAQGEPVKNGTIVIRNGLIEAVGSNVEYPRNAKIIHAENLVVVPGLVNPCTSLGHKPFYRSGVHADLKVCDEFELDLEVYTDLLRSGFTTFGLIPPGTGFPGQALAFVPQGETREAWTLNESAYILATMSETGREKEAFRQAFETARKEIEKVEQARKEWEEKQKKAQEEQAKKDAGSPEKEPAPAPDPQKEPDKPGKEVPAKKEPAKEKPEQGKDTPEKNGEKKAEEEKFVPPPINPPYKPLVDLIQKSQGVHLLVALNQASDFIHFKDATADLDIEKAYLLRYVARRRSITTSTDMYNVIEEFGKQKAQVILAPVIQTRSQTSNTINLPAAFARAGSVISFTPVNDDPEEYAAYLKRISIVVRGGLDPEIALQAITLNPARILGLDSRIGSIEKGKDGNLLFLTGEPFSALTRIEKVMIRGEVVAEGKTFQ
ncbi:MAG: amidohydrolase family protein [Planctomycetota bacterium]